MGKKELKYSGLWVAVGVSLISLVTFLSLIPLPRGDISFHFGDKLYHCAAYTLLMTWFGMIYVPGPSHAGLTAGFILMGAFLESMQGAMGHRDFQYTDIIANAAGVLIGLFLLRTRLSGFLVHIDSRIASLGKGSGGRFL